MKPKLEQIQPSFGNSFTVQKYVGSAEISPSPFWHFHPEYEIVYVEKGRGKRHVGNHISNFEGGELIFIGPNLPHLCFDEAMTQKNTEIVVQLREDFMGEDFLSKPEMTNIKRLFKRAKTGITFSNPVKKQIGKRLEKLVELSGFERFIELLSILEVLSKTPHYQQLNANGFTFEVNANDFERIQKIYSLVEYNFKHEIVLQTAADAINMTVPAFCRYFKRLTNKTFTEFVNEIRVAHACQMLSRQHESITEVCFESGFNNVSHFNRQFKNITGKSPSAFRKDAQTLIGT